MCQEKRYIQSDIHPLSDKVDVTIDVMKYLLNMGFTRNSGLVQGEMGQVLMLLLYARQIGCKGVEDLGVEWLEDLCGRLSKHASMGMFDGLCGIGWAIEYLSQNRYIEVDSDDFLEDIDRAVQDGMPRHIKDVSFGYGLAGILYYVSIRLGRRRENTHSPFEQSFLNEIHEAAHRSSFFHVFPWSKLLADFDNQLSGKEYMIPYMMERLMEYFQADSVSVASSDCVAFDCCWRAIQQISSYVGGEHSVDCAKITRRYCLFFEESPSAQYGIGTYVDLLSDCLKRMDWELTLVILRSSQTTSIAEEERNGIHYIYVGHAVYSLKSDEWIRFYQVYYRNVVALLASRIRPVENLVFHLNHMHMKDLAKSLKLIYPQAVIIATVHYMDWGCRLAGNKNLLQEVLSCSTHPMHKAVATVFNENMAFLQNCDHVIAIARHAYDTLRDIGKIPSDKLTLIPHALPDEGKPIGREERIRLRHQYGFSENDKIVVFAGRMAQLKGVDLLGEAFRRLSDNHPDLRLLIMGDGDSRIFLSRVVPCCSKVTMAGFVSKPTYFELLSLADIGVLPSLYEEFGYVAIEMMMLGIPLVVGDGSGLEEIVQHERTGYVLRLKHDFDEVEYNVGEIIRALQYFLSSPEQFQSWGREGRTRFEEHYRIDIFEKKWLDFLQTFG